MKNELFDEINRRLSFDESEFGLQGLGAGRNRTLKDILFDLIEARVGKAEKELAKHID